MLRCEVCCEDSARGCIEDGRHTGLQGGCGPRPAGTATVYLDVSSTAERRPMAISTVAPEVTPLPSLEAHPI